MDAKRENRICHEKLYPIFRTTNLDFIDYLLIYFYGRSYANSFIFSADSEKDVEEALYYIQATCKTIYFCQHGTGKLMATIPITDQLTKEQEELVRSYEVGSAIIMAL